MALARRAHRSREAEARAARRALLLRGLEGSLFGSRMPDARVVLASSGWARDPIDAACPRCGTTRAPFEQSRGGCAECRGRRFEFSGLVRLGRYAPPLSQWTPAIKQRAWQGMAEALGAELGRQVREAVEAELHPQPRFVTYVPTHWIRRVLRGIDHGRCIAEAVARELGVEMRALLKVGLWARQTGSNRGDRVGRRERFRCAGRGGRLPAEAVGATILLVDDVRTTGGTLGQAAATLRQAGAGAVLAACCAAVDPPHRSGARFARRPDGR